MRLDKMLLAMLAMMFAGVQAQAGESETDLTIYNKNLALIKKSQTVKLQKGENEIAFDEVAQQMRPESAFIFGDGVRVLEQNYDYADISYMTMLNANVGKVVKTVRQNPQNGANIFEKAVLLAVNGGNPVLKFDYGIETNFSGRVVFDEIPLGLNGTPILRAKVQVVEAGEKDLKLAYLASGFSWQANYVANVNDEKTFSLLGRVALNNASGSSYEDVSVNLIAGNVNIMAGYSSPRMYKTMMVNAVARGAVAEMATGGAVMSEPESLNGYYVYKIPQKTSLKDGQIKQVSFLDAPKVKYEKSGIVRSQLVFSLNKSFYKDLRPEVVYDFINSAEDGLGMPLPQGKISFYDYDKNGVLQFVGENRIDNKVEGQKVSVRVGEFFDVYANGAIKEIKKISERKYRKKTTHSCPTTEGIYQYEVEYAVVNNGKNDVNIVLKQPLLKGAKVLEESLKGKAGEGDEYEWNFTVGAGKSKEITAKVESMLERYGCEAGEVNLD